MVYTLYYRMRNLLNDKTEIASVVGEIWRNSEQ